MDGGGSDFLLEAHGIRKTFPGVVALHDVSFRLRPGTVHALVGENGAGKSTLMKIIAAVDQPDRGGIRLRSREVRLASPLDALEQGIAMIHQELNLMPFMTVAENIWIRREPTTRLGFVSHGELHRRTARLLGDLEIDLDPEAEVRSLSVAERQMVEIAKAISYDADVLIMDEPTSALSEREVGHLFRIIRDLRGRGKGIIYITHRMDELFAIADEVSVFRDGSHVGTEAIGAVTRDSLIRMMVGRDVSQLFPRREAAIGEVVLSVSNLSLGDRFRDVSFELRAGEILGVAGLVGSGRSNVAEAIFGVTPPTAGSIAVGGEPITQPSPREALKRGIAFITEDRKESGCFLLLDILANMEMAVLNRDFVRWGFVDSVAVDRECERMRATLRVKTPDLQEPVINLSGGNQQKVLLARWLLTRPRVLILDEPTRGIDVAAKAEIHQLIARLAEQGVAVLMISSELPEVLGMSDRILVMHEGRVTGLLDRADADQVTIMTLASD
ncbi:MAG TPA: sugar ABC transporter ATP-binding protein [Gemmatimonadales bacterium]|nr:sugar ABC transporter ATP-binding protein [Gemmatimonadales bacterium]